jgi:hypothetical protein
MPNEIDDEDDDNNSGSRKEEAALRFGMDVKSSWYLYTTPLHLFIVLLG